MNLCFALKIVFSYNPLLDALLSEIFNFYLINYSRYYMSYKSLHRSVLAKLLQVIIMILKLPCLNCCSLVFSYHSKTFASTPTSRSLCSLFLYTIVELAVNRQHHTQLTKIPVQQRATTLQHCSQAFLYKFCHKNYNFSVFPIHRLTPYMQKENRLQFQKSIITSNQHKITCILV